MSSWWTKYPLPEGWEIKYHWESKRFLYINHINKTTAWVDPRIELYKGKEEGTIKEVNESYNDDDDDASSKNSSIESAVINAKKVSARENKAHEIQKKFPEFTLEKVITLLESNYDNEFSVESKLNQELRNMIEVQEIETKRKEKEALEKVAAEKRAKEEANRHQEEIRKQEIKKKVDEEIRRNEEQKKRVEEDIRRLENEKKIQAEALEIKRLQDETKKRLEQESKLKSEEDKKKKKKKDDFDKRVDDQKNDMTNTKLPKYEDYDTGCSSNVSSGVRTTKKSANQRGPNEVLASGPNPHNYKGSNTELLSDRVRSLAKGPDPLNRSGPQTRNNCAA